MNNPQQQDGGLREAIIQYIAGVEDHQIVANDILRLFTRELQSLRDSLPEKADPEISTSDFTDGRINGFNEAVAQVDALLAAELEALKGVA